jgi:hypothetical protein
MSTSARKRPQIVTEISLEMPGTREGLGRCFSIPVVAINESLCRHMHFTHRKPQLALARQHGGMMNRPRQEGTFLVLSTLKAGWIECEFVVHKFRGWD